MNMKRLFSAVALLVAVMQPGLTRCFAQYQNTAVGTVSTCDYSGSATLTGNLFPTGRETINLNGVVSFQTIATSGPEQQPWENLAPVGFSGSGSSASFGTINFVLDAFRTPPISSIIANQPSSALPATGTLSFYITATLASQPGVVYESVQPVTESGQIFIWPHSNAQYNQINTVDFQNRAQPGVVVFSIFPGTAPVLVTARN